MVRVSWQRHLYQQYSGSQLTPGEIAYIRTNYAYILPYIVVEITEGEGKTDLEREEKIRTLRNLGVRLALDDFGKGYSNEVRILDYNPDIIKIDMELVQGINRSPDKEKLVKNLVTFCHSKDIQLVAEGIEELEDMTKLIHLGIDLLQGYYLAKPDFRLLDSILVRDAIQEIFRQTS